MKIVDCFIFYNELDLLKYRLYALTGIVDHFVIIEANQTFMGRDKELYSTKLSSILQDLGEKITHAIIDLPFREGVLSTANGNQWENERFQRNYIEVVINKLELKREDIIIISDIDEIPDPDTLYRVKTQEIPITIQSLEQDFYYYNLESKFINKWYSSKIISYGLFKNLGRTCDEIRNYACDTIELGGWHLSYFGNKEFIRNKIRNYSHNEHNIETRTNLENIQRCIDSTECIIGKEHSMIKVPISENQYLPPKYKDYLNMFYSI